MTATPIPDHENPVALQARHPGYCYDDDGKLECACGLDILDVELADELAARYVPPEEGL